MAKDFAEYKSLAEKEDAEYKKYSPALNSNMEGTAIIEFSVKEDLPKTSISWKFPTIFPEKLKSKSFIIGTKWALFQKNKLEALLRKFRKRNKSLREVLPLAIAALLHQSNQTSKEKDSLLEGYINDPDAVTLGISKHARRRGLIQERGSVIDTEIDPESVRIKSEVNSLALHLAVLRTTKGNGHVLDEHVLFEYKYYVAPAENPTSGVPKPESMIASKIKSRVDELANLLSQSGNEELETLALKGVVHQVEKGRHAFIFHYPAKTQRVEPESIKSIIIAQKTDPWKLALRFHVAQVLARTLGSFHVDRWIHKNINSQSLVFFRQKKSEQLLERTPFLVRFEYSRPDSGSTLRTYDGDREKDLYRHPDIQNDDRPSFSRLHDLYALGVVLLEIALWQTVHDIVEGGFRGVDVRIPSSEEIRNYYIKLARKNIPHRMGSAYAKAVEACLSTEFEDQFLRADFPRTFNKEIIENLSPKCLITE